MKKIQRRKLIMALAGILACPLAANSAGMPQSSVGYFSATNKFTNPSIDQPTVYQQPTFTTVPVDQLSANNYAQILDWIPAKKANICGGYYQESAIFLKFPNPGDVKTEATTVTASLPSIFSQTGTSILRGNVTVTQPGREIVADKAYLNRDPKTGKITNIDMIGNVHIREAGKLVVAQKAHINLKDNTSTMDNAVYRFSKTLSRDAMNAWGTLRHGQRESNGVLNLTGASYSTCQPTTATWKVWAQKLHLDKEKGEGTAINSSLRIEDVPVFYLPYFTFPITDQRKSGFLFPTFGLTNNSGGSLSVPYYLNLAPNYDATLTPNIFTKRGYQQNVNFRYLTEKNNGNVNLGILPDDSAFAAFKKNAPTNYADIPNEQDYLNRLNKFSDTRAYFAYTDTGVYSPHWNSLVNLNYVSDDYYFQDFATTPAAITSNQLLNDGDLNYQSDNWRFLARLQAYETLHPITQMFVQNQYRRLPELDLTGDFPNQDGGLDFGMNSQFVYFDEADQFFYPHAPVVTGERFNVEPGISWPLANMNGYFTPQFQVDGTAYTLADQSPGFPKSIDRGLPIFDIDTGLFFDREATFFNHPYRQTLEPRVFYLYVPTRNQGNIPIFDTSLPPFSFEQMFQTNRFTGLDRIGDANQVTFALTSRFLNDFTGQERLRASVGSIYLFQQHKVFCTGPSCLPDPTVNDTLAPVVGELSYNLNPVWNLTSDLAYDPNRTRTNNGNVNLIYNYGSRVFNIGYYFVRDGDVNNSAPLPITGETISTVNNEVNLNRINLGLAWPITQHWSGLADWNYNISGHYPQVYFYGAQYDSCCWATRFVIGHNLLSVDQNNVAHFDTTYYVQFQLKGLGNFGNNSPGSMLTSALPGYQDAFQTGFRPFS